MLNSYLVADWHHDTKTATPSTAAAGTNVRKIQISNFNTFGGEDFYLYIDVLDTPYFYINGGKQVVYIGRERKGGISGSERWGDNIWFGKFDPAN